MGIGYEFECSKCKYKYSVSLGMGMGYYKEYKRLLQYIKDGVYGNELQQAMKETPYAAINAERVLYICKDCGHWEVSYDVTLFAPNNPNSISKKQTDEEWGECSYCNSMELKQEYHILKKYVHKCCKCGKTMHKMSDGEKNNCLVQSVKRKTMKIPFFVGIDILILLN